MNKHFLIHPLAATTMALACSTSFAFLDELGFEAGIERTAERMVASVIAQAGSEARPDRTVRGAPYCADAVHETVQWLADPAGGAPNRIVRQQASRLCRDGEGRTRQEVERGGKKRVYLRDPVAGESWSLDPERKVATRLPARGHEWAWSSAPGTLTITSTTGPSSGWGEAESRAWRDYAERMREWARQMAERARQGLGGTPPQPPAPPVPATPGTTQAVPTAPTPPTAAVPPVPPVPPVPVIISHGESGSTVRSGSAEVTVVRVGDGPAATAMAAAMPPSPVLWSAQSHAPRGPGTVSPLPAREIDGLRVTGERTVWQIDAGRVGNERPIQIVREVWTSPDLMLTVQSRDFDPRSSEVVYRLKQIVRSEPDAALFRVPADYTRRGGTDERREERREERKEDRREPPRG